MAYGRGGADRSGRRGELLVRKAWGEISGNEVSEREQREAELHGDRGKRREVSAPLNALQIVLLSRCSLSWAEGARGGKGPNAEPR